MSGFSISGLASYLQVPELDLCFDMGECPLSAVSLNHVFLTHAHGDHSRCLMRHDSLRKMIGIARPATYYIPEAIYQGACNWVHAEALFEGVSEARFTMPHLLPVRWGDWEPLEYRPDLRFRSFPVRHSIPSSGFTIARHKRKLLQEFTGLQGPEIVRLKTQGVQITREVIEPVITYIGDCTGDSLLNQRHIWSSETLVLECTFLEEDERAMARKKGHSHLLDIVEALNALGNEVKCQRIILKHFSMKYGRKHILAHLAQGIPPSFRNRIQALI
ncbi:MAG TPA: MBL fold metallo-hydrolase [Fibrobacteraceae bacterium]|nr:MBL fold metallo-hydrolase [Fibrobacteraceae bacterium]